ncbi:MAG: hypothetical protein ACKOFH_04705, partial [Chthoniobacterales bacterium]
MKNSLSYLLVSPDALRRGWLGWILAGAVARTGGLEIVWAGLVDQPGGKFVHRILAAENEQR